MTVLRSRKVVPSTQRHSSKSGVEIEPLTPVKEVEVTNNPSYDSTPTFSNDSKSVSSQGLRRSARLSLNYSLCNAVESGGSRGKRKAVSRGNGRDSVSTGARVRVSMDLDGSGSFEEIVKQDDEEDVQRVRKVKNRRVSDSEPVQVGDGLNRSLSLRSGKKLLKPDVKNNVVSNIQLSDSKNEIGTEERKGKGDLNGVSEGSVTIGVEGVAVDGQEMDVDHANVFNGTVERDIGKFSLEEKAKGKVVEVDSTSGFDGTDDAHVNDVNGTVERDSGRFSVEEKAKGKVTEVDSTPGFGGTDDRHVKTGEGGLMETTVERDSRRFSIEEKGKAKQVEVNSSTDFAFTSGEVNPSSDFSKMDPKERFKSIARENASKFAYFSVEDGIDDEELEPEPQMEANDAVEDWPGPFSTAMKIIKDRASNTPVEQKQKSKTTPLIWVPKKDNPRERFMKVASSLEELCMEIMAQNVDAITSLDSVPDALRHKLTRALCDSRKMNHHFLNLLASGSPSEIRIRDCSWLDEDHFTKTFETIDASNLTVLQLDQCGRCLPDYVLYATLTRLPSKLSALTNISIKGACRLSDAGLNALVTCASALRSINLGCCSLLTSDGIINLADKLGSVLKELYIDECFGIDAKSILPALFKLQQLEVLSMSRFESVNDLFITQFVAVQGHKMKELVLADCTKLTDRAIKAIANNCPGLCAIDLTNLCKLTDKSLGHLANGCETIQTLKFCRNTFSDESVAAYLEARGQHLTELSLNHVDKVAHHTALSLAKHAKKLQYLDLSWCREMTDEALGLIADSCLSLRMVKLFGCTQITKMFTGGHSNENVKIVGLQGSQILKNIVVADQLPLRYSSV